MIKHALLAVAASLGVCFSLSAQEATTLDGTLNLRQLTPAEMIASRAALGMAGSFHTLNNAWYGRGPLTLEDGRQFSFPSAFGWVEASPENFLPAFTAPGLPRVTRATTLASTSDTEKVGLLPKPDYVGGEVGVFYGRSTGKYGREVEQGYILGEIIEGNTRIQVGASYGHSSDNSPRIIGR